MATQCGFLVSQMDRFLGRFLGRIRRVKTFFYKSTTAMAILHNKQATLELPQHKLIQGVPSRLNSTFDMITRFIEQNTAIEATLQMKALKKKLVMFTRSPTTIWQMQKQLSKYLSLWKWLQHCCVVRGHLQCPSSTLLRLGYVIILRRITWSDLWRKQSSKTWSQDIIKCFDISNLFSIFHFPSMTNIAHNSHIKF